MNGAEAHSRYRQVATLCGHAIAETCQDTLRIPSKATPASIGLRIAEFILLLVVFTGTVLSSERIRVVHGRVVDGSTGEGLPFADVFVQTTGYRINTNADGEFTVSLPESGAKLVVSFIGYKRSSIDAGKYDSRLIVALTPTVVPLSGLIVTAVRKSNPIQNSLELGNAQIREFSGVTRDPLRTLQLIPGVSSDNEASAKVDVRGGTWDENTVLIDGAEVYDPYHIKEIALASLSIFNSDIVRSLDFSSGGFGARYGDALSSVTSIQYVEGTTDHIKGTADITPLDMSAASRVR